MKSPQVRIEQDLKKLLSETKEKNETYSDALRKLLNIKGVKWQQPKK